MNFKNKQELDVFNQLKRKQRRHKYKIEYESVKLPYTILRNYIPDFVLTLKNGEVVYIEHKGYLRREDEKKLLAIKEQNPGIRLHIVFQKDNKMPGRKMTCSEWAIKHGISYSIGVIEDEWFLD